MTGSNATRGHFIIFFLLVVKVGYGQVMRREGLRVRVRVSLVIISSKIRLLF